MKKFIKENIKDIFDSVKIHPILLAGMGLFTYSLFNFNSNRYCDETGGLPAVEIFPSCINSATYYYYDNTTLILLATGAVLIVIGLLKLRGRNSE